MLMVSGGAIRIQPGANRNQSEKTPCCRQRCNVTATCDASCISIAINNPLLLTSLICGCFNSCKNNCSFSATVGMSASPSSTCKAASPAAQDTGCPPNVV